MFSQLHDVIIAHVLQSLYVLNFLRRSELKFVVFYLNFNEKFEYYIQLQAVFQRAGVCSQKEHSDYLCEFSFTDVARKWFFPCVNPTNKC